MCKPSVIADDWVSKGFHVHVGGVELAIRPGHARGKVAIRPVFSSTRDDAVDAAARLIREQCLEDPAVRENWCKVIERAIEYLRGYNGELLALANGRQAELRFLKQALKEYAR